MIKEKMKTDVEERIGELRRRRAELKEELALLKLEYGRKKYELKHVKDSIRIEKELLEGFCKKNPTQKRKPAPVPLAPSPSVPKRKAMTELPSFSSEIVVFREALVEHGPVSVVEMVGNRAFGMENVERCQAMIKTLKPPKGKDKNNVTKYWWGKYPEGIHVLRPLEIDKIEQILFMDPGVRRSAREIYDVIYDDYNYKTYKRMCYELEKAVNNYSICAVREKGKGVIMYSVPIGAKYVVGIKGDIQLCKIELNEMTVGVKKKISVENRIQILKSIVDEKCETWTSRALISRILSKRTGASRKSNEYVVNTAVERKLFGVKKDGHYMFFRRQQ